MYRYSSRGFWGGSAPETLASFADEMSPLGRAILEPVSSDYRFAVALVKYIFDKCCTAPLIGCMPPPTVLSQAHLGNRPDIAALLEEEEERQAGVEGSKKE